jgi:hypothetical protein
VPEKTIGEVLALLADVKQGSHADDAAPPRTRRRTDRSSPPG